MRLLIDTDVFCKLGLACLLVDAVGLFGFALADCGRLAALPHMLRRGRLRKRLGDVASEALLPIAESVPVAPQPGNTWLDKLTPIQAIDPGEAQLFAAAAELGLLVVTGDKRALLALKEVPDFPDALVGRIVVLEAALLALCDRLGAETVRLRSDPLVAHDTMVQVSFSPGNASPADALDSYYRSCAAEVAPLVLWEPRPEGRE